MSHHYHVLFLERPVRSKVIEHHFLHVLDDFCVDVLNLPLPWHALVYGGTGEWVSKSVKPVVENVVLVQQFKHVSLFQFNKQIYRFEHMLRLRIEKTLIYSVE